MYIIRTKMAVKILLFLLYVVLILIFLACSEVGFYIVKMEIGVKVLHFSLCVILILTSLSDKISKYWWKVYMVKMKDLRKQKPASIYLHW